MISLKEVFKMACRSLRDSLSRTILTMLGIIIGVTAVIVMTAVVNGRIQDQKDTAVRNGIHKVMVDLNRKNKNSRDITPEQLYEFQKQNQEQFVSVSPFLTVSSGAMIYHGDKKIPAYDRRAYGVGEDYLEINRRSVSAGRDLQYADLEGENLVCVIGKNYANTLYGSTEAAVGQTLMINSAMFQVIGVLSPSAIQDDFYERKKEDSMLIVPYTVCKRLTGSGTMSQFLIEVSDFQKLDTDIQLVKNFVQEKRGDIMQVEFQTRDQDLKALKAVSRSMNQVAVGIAAISLLIAGVGVMNVELVAVRERTREIGIRKSLGAQNDKILEQFIIEAVIISLLGGVAGVLLGVMVVWGIGRFSGMQAVLAPWAVWLSLGVSIAIGIFFGYLPARQASRMKPIDALRAN